MCGWKRTAKFWNLWKTSCYLSVDLVISLQHVQYLAYKAPVPGRTAGFGHYNSGLGYQQVSPVLLHASLPIVSRQQCQIWRGSQLTPEEICAGHATSIAVCNGDSGGGLVFDSKVDGVSRYYVQGIVSHGYVQKDFQCESYGVFTRVNSHVRWIHKQVQALNISSFGNEYNEEESLTSCPLETPICPASKKCRSKCKTESSHKEVRIQNSRSFFTFPATTSELDNFPTTASVANAVNPIMSVGTTSSYSLFTDYQELALRRHNNYRALHHSPPLRLNERLCAEARLYAEKLIREGVFENHNEPGHTGETLPFLKNIFELHERWGSVPATEIVVKSVDSWYKGASPYNWNRPRPSTFSQLVWKSTTEFGLGMAVGFQNGVRRTVVVAAYSPPGNIDGTWYHKQNVFPRLR